MAAGLLSILLAAPVGAASNKPVSTAVFFGFDIGPNTESIYGGAITAVNGDFAKDGILLRGVGVYSWYNYDATVGGVDGDLRFGDAMVGYQILRPGLRLAAFAGVEYQDHRLSPFDPTNPVVGTDVGFKIFGDVTLGGGEPVFLNVLGGYSTAFDSYWGRARLGFDLGRVTIGPEAILGGNESYDAQRVGAFLSVLIPETPLEITFSGGAHLNEDDGIFGDDDGGYGGVNIGWVF